MTEPAGWPDAGPDAARRDRRAALLEALADHLLAHGLGSATLRQLARAAGTSDRMLLYYFRDKAEIVEAALDLLAARLTAGLDALRAPAPLPEAALRARLVPAVLDPGVAPFMRLWLEVATAGARGDPVCRTAGRRIAEGFLGWIGAQLSETGAARRAAAARILASVEGLVVLQAVGLADDCAEAVASGQPDVG